MSNHETGDCIMYSANGLVKGENKITMYPMKPTLKSLGECIAKHDATFGHDHVMFAIYKGRKTDQKAFDETADMLLEIHHIEKAAFQKLAKIKFRV